MKRVKRASRRGQARQGVDYQERALRQAAWLSARRQSAANLILESRARRVSTALFRDASLDKLQRRAPLPIDPFVSAASFTARAAANEDGNKTAPVPASLISLSRGRAKLHFAFICFDNAPFRSRTSSVFCGQSGEKLSAIARARRIIQRWPRSGK